MADAIDIYLGEPIGTAQIRSRLILAARDHSGDTQDAGLHPECASSQLPPRP
jgi:hypothetical protein